MSMTQMIRGLGLALLISLSSAWAQSPGHVCLIEPYQRVELRSPVEALIVAVNVDRGSVVKKGQVLVLLESGVEEAALSSSRFRSSMESEKQIAEARLSYTRDKLRRKEELRSQNFISQQERDDAYAEMRVAEAELNLAADNMRLSALESKRLEEVIRQRRLIAPFTGIVTDRLQHPGELSFTGEGARPILKLAQTHPLRVEVVLPVSLYGTVKAGSTGLVTPEPPLKGQYRATVRVVDKVVDSASGTFGVRLELQNPRGDIPAGVRCRVKFGN